MTFSEMVAKVFRRLGENPTSPAFWTEEAVKAAINEGYHTLADATEWFETEAMIPLSDFTGNYLDMATLNPMKIDEFASTPDALVDAHDQRRMANPGFDFNFASFLAFRRVFNLQTNAWMTMVDVRDLDSSAASWGDATGEPEHFFLRGLWNLGVYPATTTGSIKARIAADPPSLDGNADTPAFPQEFHDALIEYALYELYLQDKESQKALIHWAAYQEREAELAEFVRSRVHLDRIGVFGR